MPQDGYQRSEVGDVLSPYNWKKKCGGLGTSELRRLRQLEAENHQLKKLVADLSLDKQMLQDVIGESLSP